MNRTPTPLLALAAAAALFFAIPMLSAAQSAPANVAGNWQISMQGPNGNTTTRAMSLEQDGANLKGTIKGRRGDQALTGTVNGNEVSWTVEFAGRNGRSFKLEYKATVAGDTMKGTVGRGRFQRDFTAQRASSQ